MFKDYMTGAELLAAWNLTTREEKLEQAVKALMQELESSHCVHEEQSLADNLENTKVSCSCADAYRMGHEALKIVPAKESIVEPDFDIETEQREGWAYD